MRLTAAALCAPLCLFWAACACALPAGTAGNPTAAATVPTSAVLPSIEILLSQTHLAGTCGGQAFNVNTYINVDSQASSEVRLSAPGFPTLEQFTDETGSNIGPFSGVYPTFSIQAFGGGLSPNTPLRVTITTYSGRSLSGSVTYTSSIQFNCTTGTILDLVAAAPGDPVIVVIPTLSEIGLAATALLLALAGLWAMRMRVLPTRPRRGLRQR